MKAFFIITQHEILLTLREAHSWLTPLLFFIIVVSLFPLALGSDTELLKSMAGGIIWVAVLLAIIISMDHLFRQDFDEGYLDLMLMSPHPLTLLVLCKILSHWITHCLPLILLSPLLGILLQLSGKEECALFMTLLLGTPVLCLIGAVGAALIVGIRHHGLLLPILIMPFYIPVLVFGTGIVMLSSNDQSLIGYYALMAAWMLLCFAFAPLLTSVALRIGVNQ